MNLEELIIRLQNEEGNRAFEKKVFILNDAKANVVEYEQSYRNKKTKPRLEPKGGVF